MYEPEKSNHFSFILHSFWEVAVCLERNGASCGTLWAGMFLNLTASPEEKEVKKFYGFICLFVVVDFCFVCDLICLVFINWSPLNSVWIDSRCHIGLGGTVFVHCQYLMELIVFVRLRGKREILVNVRGDFAAVAPGCPANPILEPG